jgi:hypothetical protein
MAGGCASSSPVYDSRPQPIISERVRRVAADGPHRIAKCGDADHACVKGQIVAIRQSELRNNRALRSAVRAVDRVRRK